MEQQINLDGNVLTSLDLAEVLYLSDWCAMQRVKGQFENFNRWLWQTLEAEKERRDQVDAEPLELSLPWDAGFMADALPALHVLTRLALTHNLAAFVDEVDRHAMAAASSMLALIKATFV